MELALVTISEQLRGARGRKIDGGKEGKGGEIQFGLEESEEVDRESRHDVYREMNIMIGREVKNKNKWPSKAG